MINKKKVNIKYVSAKGGSPAMWLTFTTAPISQPIKVLEIEDSLFTELFEDQQNIVNVKITQSESYILNSKKRAAIYNSK